MTDTPKIKGLESLFQEFQPILVRFAYKYVRNAEDARGIVQEVFLSIWRNRENLIFDRSLKAYLFTATKNKALNFLDKKKLHVLSINNESDDHPIIQIADGDSIAQEEMELAELESVIFDEVSKLPPKCRAIFQLSRSEQLSYKEIAAQLDITPKTVENQISIALKRIRKRLQSYHDLHADFAIWWLIAIFFDTPLGEQFLNLV